MTFIGKTVDVPAGLRPQIKIFSGLLLSCHKTSHASSKRKKTWLCHSHYGFSSLCHGSSQGFSRGTHSFLQNRSNCNPSPPPRPPPAYNNVFMLYTYSLQLTTGFFQVFGPFALFSKYISRPKNHVFFSGDHSTLSGTHMHTARTAPVHMPAGYRMGNFLKKGNCRFL